jgi:two-component system, cell cycle sensor histidine kinase and response regulator CckA
MFKHSHKIILGALVIAVAAWTLDAMFYRLLHPEFSFLNLLLFDIPSEELAERSFHVAVVTFGAVVVWRIFSWRRRATEALWEGQRLLDTVLTSIQEALIIKDDNYTIIRVNPAMARWFAHAEPLAGKKCYAALRGRSQPCEECPCRQALETGAAASLVVPKIGPAGTQVGWLELYSYPLFDRTTGKTTGVIEFARDITQRRQAQEALRESETRYRLLVSNIPAVVFKGYLDWTIDFVDEKIEELTGYQKEEFNSRRLKWSDLILAEDLIGVQEVFMQALKTTRKYVREYRLKRRDGEIIWIQARGQIVCDPQGRVEYVSGVFFDIGERKQSEKALKRSQASLAEAQRLVHLGNWEWNTITGEAFWSDEVYRILGVAPREIPATFKGFLKTVHPHDHELVRQSLGRALYRGIPYRIGHRIRRPDGSERFVYAQGEVDADAHGKPVRMLGTIQDITERRRAQEALKESERRYRLLAENVTDVIWTMDLDLQLTYVSPSIKLLTGYDIAEYKSLALEQMLPPAAVELARNKLAEELALEPGETDPLRSTIMEIEIYRRDGSTVWTEVKASLLREADGRPTEVLGVTRDITMRRQLEEQLQQSQKMEVVGRLAGGVAHDFNNLLTAILGYCELLLSSLPATDPTRQDVAEIKKAGERAALLTRQLLAFSRRQVLQPKSLDLNQVLENLGKMLKRVMGEDIELSIVPGPELGRVMADPGQIEQVIMNLAVNARDAMPQGGKLVIKTGNVDLDEAYAALHTQVQPGPQVLLAVTDTGCGMDAATRSQIFEPFFTTKELGKGTGLGLSTVYGIIRQSGGHIWVYSEPGQGTTFKIYLPRVTAALPAPEEARFCDDSLEGRETILLVEDEDLVRQVARRILQSHGYVVLEAGNGHEALQVQAQHQGPIHLVLTDLVMPGLGGQELANRLTSRCPAIKVLFMSGYAEDGIMDKNLAAPGLVYIQKPFEAYALTRKVREFLDASPSQAPAAAILPRPLPIRA